MRYFGFKFCSLCIILLSFTIASFAAEIFTLDPQHTYVLWHIKHLGFSNQAGKWYANGTLLLDKDNPQNSKVKVNIQIANMITGIPELDKHLKGKQFFDIENFPTANFISNKIESIDKKTAKVYGTLTLHGISKPIILNVILNNAGENPVTHKMTVGFSATSQLKRSDFGINQFLPALGDEVTLDIETEAYQEKNKD